MQTLRFSLTYGAVASTAAAAYVAGRGETRIAACTFGLALALLAGRAAVAGWIGRETPGQVYTMCLSSIPERRQLVAPVLALLLVTSALGTPGVVDPAAATHNCSTTERLVTFTFGLTGFATDQLLRGGECTDSHRAEAIQQMEESDAAQEKLDIYNAALSQEADNRVFQATYRNYLNDSAPNAWMHAETAVAQAYQNGSAKSVANANAKTEIGRYYTVKQANFIEKWEVSVSSFLTLRAVAANETGIDEDYVNVYAPQDYDYESDFSNVTEQHTVTLANGSTRNITTLVWSHYQYNSNGDLVSQGTVSFNPVEGFNTTNIDVGAQDMYLRVGAPNADVNATNWLNMDTWEADYARIQTKNSDLQAETDPFVNATWDAFVDGQINASDVISRNNLMFNYATDATGDDSKGLYNTVAALASMGLDTPELNGTGTMEVTYRGSTYNGMVLAREAPNGSWTARTTYNTSEFDGVVILATTSGETIEMADGEPFTIDAMTAEDGSDLESVNTTKIVYKTSNTTELLEKMNRIIEMRQEIESREPKAGGGGTGDSGGPLAALAAFLGVSVGAAVAGLVLVGLLAVRIYAP